MCTDSSQVFTLQADGRTDAGNMANELFFALYFDSYANDGNSKVHVCNRFLMVRHPKSGTAEGLRECFQKVVSLWVL